MKRLRSVIHLTCITLAITIWSIHAAAGSSLSSWNDFIADSPKQLNINLHITDTGRGEPIILLHGFASNSYTWRHIAPSLAKTHRVITVDLKGFGRSPKPRDGAYSIYDQARLITNLIRELNLNNVTIVGNSYGGGLSLLVSLYMQHHQASVIKKLILVDSIGHSQPTQFFLNFFKIPGLEGFAEDMIPEDVIVQFALQQCYHDASKITPEMITAYAAPLGMRNGVYGVVQTAKQMIPNDSALILNKLNDIKLPTLIIWGENDRIIPLSIGRKLQQQLKNSKLVIIKNSGHLPQEESPQETLSAIQSFL